MGKTLPPIDSITDENLICKGSSSISISSGSKRGPTDDVDEQAIINHRINCKKTRNLAQRKKKKKTISIRLIGY